MNTAMFLACSSAGRNFKFQSPRQKKTEKSASCLHSGQPLDPNSVSSASLIFFLLVMAMQSGWYGSMSQPSYHHFQNYSCWDDGSVFDQALPQHSDQTPSHPNPSGAAMKASQCYGTTFDYLAEEYSSPLGNPIAGHASFRQHLWQTTALSPQPQSLHQQQFQFTMQQQEQNHVTISSSPANQAINKGVPCQTQSKVIFQVLLDSKQASNLVKRAFRWPDMGVVSKDQELTQELLQKMIDKLAEPFSRSNAGKSISVRLRPMNFCREAGPIAI